MDYKTFHEHSEKLVRAVASNEFVSNWLGKLESYHEPTYKHSIKVAKLSADLGIENGYREPELEYLVSGALLHDIGKVSISKDILDKKELTEKELAKLSKVPWEGYHITYYFGNPAVRELIGFSVQYLNGKQIGLLSEGNKELAQMLAISDLTDELYSKPHKESIAHPEVPDMLKDKFHGNRKYLKQVLKRLHL